MFKKYIIEFLGTFVMLSLVLTFILFFNTSKHKYHFNPAVTIIMLYDGTINKLQAFIFLTIQLISAYCAYMFINKFMYDYIKNF